LTEGEKGIRKTEDHCRAIGDSRPGKDSVSAQVYSYKFFEGKVVHGRGRGMRNQEVNISCIKKKAKRKATEALVLRFN